MDYFFSDDRESLALSSRFCFDGPELDRAAEVQLSSVGRSDAGLIRPKEGTAKCESAGKRDTRERMQVCRLRANVAGARYRVRTCDPYRVKVVLYH